MFENPDTKKILSVLLFFAIVLSSFYVLDFRAAQSKTQASSGVSAYSSGNPDIDFSGRIHLYIEGDNALTAHLKEKFREDIEAAGMEVIVVDTVEEKYGSQVLLVNVSESEGLYTPVYASSDLNIMFFYTSTGEDTKYFEQFKNGNNTVVFVNKGSSQGEKLIQGEIELQDTTKGPVSLIAYRKHLASEASKGVIEQLLQHVRSSLPPGAAN